MTDTQQRAAKQFADDWKVCGDEKQDDSLEQKIY